MGFQQHTSRRCSTVLLDTSPDQEERFKAAFRVKRRLQWLLLVPVVGALVAAALEAGGPTLLSFQLGLESWEIHLIAVLVFLGAVAFSVWNWRCPACRRWLRGEVNPRFCIRCGCAFD